MNELKNRIERFKEVCRKKMDTHKKLKYIDDLTDEIKDIYQFLMLSEDDTTKYINVSYSSKGIFIQYKLEDDDTYLRKFVSGLKINIYANRNKYSSLYILELLKFLVSFIQTCYLHTSKDVYLEELNTIYVDLLFSFSNHTMNHNY